jgi:methyl-accepting chemotaxis protein
MSFWFTDQCSSPRRLRRYPGTYSTASAARELAASITEINRQLNHTVEAVNAAVATAAKWDSEIAALGDAAQKIGNVVKLIQHIAV